MQLTKPKMRSVLAASTAAFALLAAPAHAALVNFYSATGKLGLSVDGCGTASNVCSIDALKPSAVATVKTAFLMSASTGLSGSVIPDNSISLAGVPVTWIESVPSAISSNNYRADVTAIVKPILDAAAPGISAFEVDESVAGSSLVDGNILVVVFDDPAQTKPTSVLLNFGAQAIMGDTFNVTLASPIDPATPGAQLDMGLGISFGYQEGSAQNSTVQVNGQTVTSSAGGDDDGEHANGALITVGGLGDSNDNPADPLALATTARYDDELYSLLPFLPAGTTSISTYTINASSDDNIFFAYFQSSAPAIIGAGVLLSQAVDTHTVGAQHTAQAVINDDNGIPQANVSVTFNVSAGPNAGATFTGITDAEGKVNFTYAGNGGVGTDTIQASFVSSGNTITSNTLDVVWTAPVVVPPVIPPTPTPVPTLGGIGLLLLSGLVAGSMGFMRRRKVK